MDFNLSDEVARLRQGDPRVGAVCAFVGTVRDRGDSGGQPSPSSGAEMTLPDGTGVFIVGVSNPSYSWIALGVPPRTEVGNM